MTRLELVRNWLIYWVVVVGLFVVGTALFMGCDVATAGEFDDLSVVHKVLIGEAGGEKDRIRAMEAVANTIRNRAKRRGMTFEEVVRQKWQYSCLNGGEARLDAFIRKNRGVWDDALTAWQLSGVEDVTGGADHYFADYIKRPSWAKSMQFTRRIGQHLFYKS